MKIPKDPYVLCGLSWQIYPHSTHFWASPHCFSVNGFTGKAPIPHISSTFSKCCHRTQAFSVSVQKTPQSTHNLCHFDFYPHFTHGLTNFTPILCPHNSTPFFNFRPPIPHQILFEHATPHFLQAASPGHLSIQTVISEVKRLTITHAWPDSWHMKFFVKIKRCRTHCMICPEPQKAHLSDIQRWA